MRNFQIRIGKIEVSVVISRVENGHLFFILCSRVKIQQRFVLFILVLECMKKYDKNKMTLQFW